MHKRHIDGEEHQQIWDEAVEMEVERLQRGGTPGTPVGNEFFAYFAHTAGDSVQAPTRRILNASNMPFLFLPNLTGMGGIQQRDSESVCAPGWNS